ncbi:MAG TPA: nuclear transport factor 2 family protein [Solirubrobacterales bacterium]
MSKENVEIVLDQWDAWSDGNLDRWAQGWDPEVVVVAPKGWPEGDVEQGIEAWRRQAQRLRDTWAEARIEVDEIRDVKDRVLVRFRYVTVGEDTGIPFETPHGRRLLRQRAKDHAGVFRLDDGRRPRSSRAAGVGGLPANPPYLPGRMNP